MPAKRSINENSGFLGGGKGNGPSMASNILDVLADFIERAGGRIFTQGCFIRQQSDYLISTRTLKKSSSFAADSDISTQSPDISEVRANSVNFLLDFSSLDNSGCVVIFGVPSTIEIDAVNLSVALFPFRSERSARPRHAIETPFHGARRLPATRARRRGGRCRCDGRPRRRQSCPRPHRHCQRPRAGLPPDP